MTRKFVPCINNPETEEMYSALKSCCCCGFKSFQLCPGVVYFFKDFISNVCISMQKFKCFNQVSPQSPGSQTIYPYFLACLHKSRNHFSSLSLNLLHYLNIFISNMVTMPVLQTMG